MPQDQQALVLLALLGLGVFLLLPKRQGEPPIPPSGSAVPQVQPYFQNEEVWDVKRDVEGRVTGFVVHRNVQVARK